MSELASSSSFCATEEHTTTRKTKAAGHFDTFVSSMITFAKNDDNSKFNEYLSSLLPIDIEKDYDETTVSDSESNDSDDEEEI